MSNSPERNTRYLEENNDTLFQERVKNETNLRNLRLQSIRAGIDLSKKSISDLNKLEKNAIDDINRYKSQLLDKYAAEVAQGILTAEQAEKKSAKNIYDYIYIKKKEQQVKNKKEEFKNIEDRKLAAKRAELEIFKLKKDHAVYEQKFELDAQQQRISAIKAEYSIKSKYLAKQIKDNKKAKKDSSSQKKQMKELYSKFSDEMSAQGASKIEILKARSEMGDLRAETQLNALDSLKHAAQSIINNLKNMFDNTIQTYGTYQSKINTRLQGSGLSWNGVFGIGGIESNLKYAIGTNPYVKLQTVMDNVVKATEEGIAFNIEQRAFLQTVSENIASTFDAFDSNLLRVIRIQQADTTAARLGMEAGLTSFLNNYFHDNSYLNNAFDTVSQNLFEATSQLTAESAVEVEYQIQKWLGSLYSVGFSDSAVSKISQSLGYLGSGNISALSNDSAMQNLIVMAMNKAGLSYGDLMTSGLTASDTNKLLESMVEYLEEIANSDNKVVKSQYAEVFGMTVSDLEAAKNLKSSIKNISKSSLNYSGAMNELSSQMNSLGSRVSVAGMLQNLYDNFNYSIGTTIASNPVMYALWQVTSAIEDLTGGIELPLMSYLGTSFDLKTSVTDLMRGGIVGVGSLGGIGSIISGLSSSLLPSSMLNKLGISGNSAKSNTRGTSINRRSNALNQTSTSTYIGNSSGDDYYNQTLTSADQKAAEKIDSVKKESTDITLNNIHEYLLSVFDPKITDIEKMLASVAGYDTKSSNWSDNGFSGNISSNYNATKITVLDNNKDILSNKDILNDIRSNSSDILALLEKVISDSGIKIDYGFTGVNYSGGGL